MREKKFLFLTIGLEYVNVVAFCWAVLNPVSIVPDNFRATFRVWSNFLRF